MANILDQIRDSCEFVADNSRWVSLNMDRVMMYPEILLRSAKFDLQHSKEHHYLGKGDDTLRFFIILDTINFGSGYFPYLNKEKDVSGYYTVAKRLTDYVSKNGIPTADFFIDISPMQCANIFNQQIDSKHMFELMSLFAVALSDLGRWLCEYYDGDYLGVLYKKSSVEDYLNHIMLMPSYQDKSKYFGRDIWFLKRAQILIQDMSIAEPKHKLLQFSDINKLTIFADNVIPFVFRVDQLLTFDPWLEARVENEELIGSGSPEEVEIRACAVHLGEIIAKIIREEFRPISAREIDYLLWMRGQELKKITTLKRHRTRCMYY